MPTCAEKNVTTLYDPTIEAEIVRLAYTAAVEPATLQTLLDAMNEQLTPEGGENAPDSPLECHARTDGFVDRITPHIRNAKDVLEMRGPLHNAAAASRRVVLQDSRPAALFDGKGYVRTTNFAGSRELGLKTGSLIPWSRIQEDERVILRDILAELDRYQVGEVLHTMAIRPQSDHSSDALHIALLRAEGERSEPLVRLSTLSIGWQEEVGRKFQLKMGLSDKEMLVVRAVIEGEALQDVAERRSRGIGTIRKQLKSVYAKTGVHSKVRLVALYAEFARLTRFDTPTASEIFMPLKTRMRRRHDGTMVQVDYAGPAKGRPVLFFHSAISGHSITPEMSEALSELDIRLVMPWRPGWAGTEFPLDRRPYENVVVDDIHSLLDDLHIDTIPVIADDMGCIHAMASAFLARRNSRPRLSQLLCVSPSLPVMKLRDRVHLNEGVRKYFMVGRCAPSLLDTLVRISFAKIESGFDEEHARNLHSGSRADQEIISDDSHLALLRRNFEWTRQQGAEALAHDLKLQVSAWPYLDALEDVPIKFLVGEEHFATGSAWPSEIAASRDTIEYEMVPNAGSLLMFSKPRRILTSLLDMID